MIRRLLRPRAALLLVALAAPAAASAAPAASGASRNDAPLGVGTPGPLRALFLDMPLADARTPAAPALDVRWYAANGWSTPTRVTRGGRVVAMQGDAQTDALQLGLELPWRRLGRGRLAARTTTTLEARLLAHWGGWSDPVIETWHGAVSSWNFQRERFPESVVRLVLAEEGGVRIAELRSSRVALGDVALRTRVRLAGGDGPDAARALALRLDLKLPTGAPDRLGGSGGFDAGVGLSGTLVLGPRLTVHALASLRAVSRLRRAFPLQPRRLQGGLEVSLVVPLGRGVALVLEDRLHTPLLAGGWVLDGEVSEPQATAWYAGFRTQNQISGGVRVGDLTVFFSEDFTVGSRIPSDPGPGWFYGSNAPDVVLGVSWSRRL